MVYVALGVFLLLADRVARLVARGSSKRRERARHDAAYPQTSDANQRFPSA